MGYQIGTIVDHFTLLDDAGAPITGAVNGDFTVTIYQDGAATAVVATVAEISNGNYSLTFTAATAGKWYAYVVHTSSGRKLNGDYAVGLDAVAHAVLVDVTTSSVRVRAWLERNGARVTDATSCTVTVYDSAATAVGTITTSAPTFESDAQGYFVGIFSISPALTDNETYGVTVSVTDPSGTVLTQHGQITVAGGA